MLHPAGILVRFHMKAKWRFCILAENLILFWHMQDKSNPNTFVAAIDLSLAKQLQNDLIEQGFTLSTPPYTLFSAKKKGISCTLYQSGKLTVQGKDKDTFIEFYLEPHILKSCAYTYPEQTHTTQENLLGRIGIDESGKGDFFGPLCIAGVFAEGQDILRLKALGVRDSKTITDKDILKISAKTRESFTYHIVRINPLKYNELYGKFLNLNRLLAWGHATTIENLVEKTQCQDVVIDQFAAEHIVITALSRKKLKVNLTQRHRAEEDVVVAAASILARAAFLEGLEKLSREFELPLPKGASAKTIEIGRQFARQYGKEALEKVCKLHFKTLDSILT
ncbi:ribonuclease HIII [Parachlamydia acanthamoebae]|uniref:Ribonuclease HIII n=1 Tax=Parachlamydia acanthamoebae TaxID=83552 RepID=A0A0C1C8V2_9BACT|nr:ribonuclease HIII [Parachlamydia acanthamoebae]KIA77465.1 Ribonuclease HIII [Parachlamydia acanthamoebae]